MSFPRYPEYKDSGINLLEAVPAHWDLKRFKRIFCEREARSESGAEILLSVSAYTGVTPRSEVIDDGDHLSRADSLEGYKICFKNDLVMNIMLAWNRGLAFTEYYGIVSPAYCVFFVIDGSEPKFLNYLVRSNEYTLYFKAYSSGVIDSRLRIYPDTFGRLFCALPPLPEQTQIAAFLDRETAKIDALVAEQRRLMALLKEKRQAVISHAVTRGLNPHAPLKPSGIEWLGDVPEHWEVGPLKRYWRVTDCKHVTAEFVDEGIPLASIREVQSRWVELESAKCTTEHFYELLIEGGRQPLPGDLIFSRNATVGEVAQVHTAHPRFAMGQDVVLLRKLMQTYSSDYLQHVIRSPIIILQLANMMIGSTFKRINVEEIRSFVMPSPPPTEQAAIASFLETESTKFDTLTTEAQRAIDLLQERRTALISAAVTGQIDVRGAA
jgi:type I restriction enzyme S subunit